MTKRLEYTKAHHLSTLHDELIAAGFHPVTVEGEGAEHPYKLALTFPDGDKVDEAAVAAVVAAHDRAAAVRAWDAARQTERDEDTQVRGLVAQLDEGIALFQGAGAITGAQIKAGLLLALRAVRLIVRYELRRRGA